MPSFYTLMGVPPTGFDPSHTFTTSWLLPPLGLALTRLLFSIYCFATTFTDWGWFGTHSQSYMIGQEFSYFTQLTFWGLSFYFLVSGIHTFIYNVKGYSWLERWPRPLQVLHSLYYTTVVTYPWLVTIVFWAVIYLPPWFTVTEEAWSNISRHMLNSLFALFEIVCTSTNPLPWLHIPFLILILLLYLAVAYITYATEHFYVYDFLDPKTSGRAIVAAYCFGIFAAILIIFLVVWGLIWVRRRFTRPGKKSKKDIGLGRGRVYSDGDGDGHEDVEMRSAEPKR